MSHSLLGASKGTHLKIAAVALIGGGGFYCDRHNRPQGGHDHCNSSMARSSRQGSRRSTAARMLTPFANRAGYWFLDSLAATRVMSKAGS
jgi:hypothetical protein